MSLTSKVVLSCACALSAATMFYVHYKQWSDKQKLHDGVLRDIERQRRRKIENLYMLQQQGEIKKILKREQSEEIINS